MKRFFAWAAAGLIAAAMLFPVSINAISAQKAILMDATSGRILYAKDVDSRSLIASTTKIMTALVVCQHCNVLDRVSIPEEAVGIEGSSMYLQEGEVLTVQELLYGLMLRSGNDAAVALAIYCGGTVEGFAEMMNDKARLIGLTQSHFVNPHGLDAPDHYSTARDLALLSAYAMTDPVFSMTVSTKSVTIGERVLRNHNKLLWQIDGADGVKTGYTKAAGRLLVSSASREGRRLICVTINAPSDWSDHKKLIEQGFSDYVITKVLEVGDVVAKVDVAGGITGQVSLIASQSFSYPVTKDEVITISLPGIGFVYAPVEEGDAAGFAHILVDGNVVGKVELLYGQTDDIIKEPKRSIIQKLFSK